MKAISTLILFAGIAMAVPNMVPRQYGITRTLSGGPFTGSAGGVATAQPPSGSGFIGGSGPGAAGGAEGEGAIPSGGSGRIHGSAGPFSGFAQGHGGPGGVGGCIGGQYNGDGVTVCTNEAQPTA